MKIFNRRVGAFISAALLVFCLSADTLAAARISGGGGSADVFSDIKSLMPDEGAYRLSDGKGNYLDGSILETVSGGEYSAEESELDEAAAIFLVRKSGDFTFTLTESSGDTLLAFDSAANMLTSEEKSGSMTDFSCLRLTAGGYMISPSNSGNPSLSLTRDGEFVIVAPYTGADSQIWYLEPVYVTDISLPVTEIELHPGTSHVISAVTKPASIPGVLQYGSSDPSVATVDAKGKITALKKGTAEITVSSGELFALCSVTVTPVSADAFYSQHNLKESEGGWDGESLSRLRFSSKLFCYEHYNSLYDWMDEGCLLCCVAMVLKNLGAKMTTGYDIRTDKTDDLDADPYTVALANSGNYGAMKFNANLSGDPVLMDIPRVLSRFTVNGSAIAYNKSNAYNKTSWYISVRQIKEALDDHPEGVIVGFYQNDNTQHYVVYTECTNPDDKWGNYKFTVCDPCAYDPAAGDHVPFEECLCYTLTGYRESHIISLSSFTVLSDFSAGESLVGNRVRDFRIK